jgi:hypothetical protein
MPQLIEHIDAIARQRGRDVLYLEFHSHSAWRMYRYEADPARDTVLAWLDQEQVGWEPCGPYASPLSMLPWLGQVCLDVPFDESLAEYCMLRDYFELPDGTMRHAGVRFCVMPLSYANQNAEHDEPGFWGRVSEDF